MPFTQKYAIIQLFEAMPEGTEFSSSNWPLHVTIVSTFATSWNVPTMGERLTEVLSNHPQAISTATRDRFFGDEGQTQVILLEKTESLVKLHYDVIDILKLGGLKLNDPHFACEGFLPHATVQSHRRINKGDKEIFDTLSIVDMFPNKNPYQRKILKTIKIGGK